MRIITEEDNTVSGAIVSTAMKVHTALGPGLLEKVYEECMAQFLLRDGFAVERQKEMPVSIDGVSIDTGFRLDMLVNNTVIVELKAVEKIAPVHEAQLYTYLKLTGKPIGLLLNFNVPHMRDGVKRMVMT